MTTANGRCRIVTTQNDAEHVSSVILTEAEAVESLQVEAELHRLAGWRVSAYPDGVVARRQGIERVLSIRVSDPFTDTPRKPQVTT